MKTSEEIKGMMDRYSNTDSIKEKEELKSSICSWCYNLIRTIHKYEESMEDLDKSLSLTKDHCDRGTPKDSREYPGTARTSIMYSLKQIKEKIKELENTPEDFKKIINNSFWDLI